MTVSVDKLKLIESRWYTASWEDYKRLRDDQSIDHAQLFFAKKNIWLENMGGEGINHAKVRELFVMIFGFWFAAHPQSLLTSMGGCQLEKEGILAVAPDLILYVGEAVPSFQEGERRYIDLNLHRVPDLVGEVSDTTLASDMRQKWDLYAELGIPEYWVIDVKGRRVFAFSLSEHGAYDQIDTSRVLPNLKIALLDQTLERLSVSNVSAATWFMSQIKDNQEGSR